MRRKAIGRKIALKLFIIYVIGRKAVKIYMENEILYKSVKAGGRDAATLDYYIIPENISVDYCDLKCYGIKIQKTTVYEGGGKMVESKQINNVFYRYDDVPEFLDIIIKRKIEPSGLRASVESYITESIDRAKKSA